MTSGDSATSYACVTCATSRRPRATYLPRGGVASEVGERALEPAVDLVQRQLFVRRLHDRLPKDNATVRKGEANKK